MISIRNFAWRAARIWLAAAAIVVLAAFAGSKVQAMTVETLEIASKTGVHIFQVEIASNEEEKQKGLMYRRELADGKGMLFPYPQEKEISMWMKNTYISLDMIFIRADGRIMRIAENTETESTAIVGSEGLALAVLEVAAGTAKKYGIAPGDRVSHRVFKKR